MILDHHEVLKVVKIFFPRSGGSKNSKKKTFFFFKFLMLNISSIKELLHQPSEIQWNIAETLPGKQERKISWALSYKICPEIIKMGEIAILRGLGNQCGIPLFFMILWISESFSLYLLVKNSFKLGFFTYFEYISGGIIRKNILHQDYHNVVKEIYHKCKQIANLSLYLRNPDTVRFKSNLKHITEI